MIQRNKYIHIYITMPKKRKAGKNTKSKNITEGKRNLIEPDLTCQVFGILTKTLGSRFFDVNCLDGKQRRCKVRNKRLRVKQDDVVIISLREFDDKNADIIYTIDNGKIENKGNHEHLMENSAVYKKLQLQENSNEN